MISTSVYDTTTIKGVEINIHYYVPILNYHHSVVYLLVLFVILWTRIAIQRDLKVKGEASRAPVQDNKNEQRFLF